MIRKFTSAEIITFPNFYEKLFSFQVFTAFLLCAVCCVYANPKYCDSTSVDETARDACKDLMQKRSISELTQLGYVVEDVKGKLIAQF